jgi:hypothetical protein
MNCSNSAIDFSFDTDKDDGVMDWYVGDFVLIRDGIYNIVSHKSIEF